MRVRNSLSLMYQVCDGYLARSGKAIPGLVRVAGSFLFALRNVLVAAGFSALAPAVAGAQSMENWSLPQASPGTANGLVTRRDCSRGSEGDEIVVCGRRNDDARYRVPPSVNGFDPDGPMESVSRERNRMLEGGEAGTGSCSTVGAGGWTGCFALAVNRARQQRAGH